MFDDNAAVWGNGAAEESKARTVKDYWDSIVSDGAQAQLFGNDYAPLPPAVLAISRAGLANLDWDKASNPPPPPPVCGPDHPELCPPPPPVCDDQHPELCPPPPPPSNKIALQRTKIDSSKGSVTVSVRLPGAGELKMVGKSTKPKLNVGKVTLDANEAGTYDVKLKPSSAAKRVLKKKGKLKVGLTLTFTPDGGDAGKPKTTNATLRLKK